MHHSFTRTTRLTIATALTGTTLAALAVTAMAPGASAETQQFRSDSRINIASVSVRSLALTLSPKPGTAVLTWAAPRTRTKYTVMATPVKRPSAARMLKATAGPVISFAGLDENARYTFTVTPQVGTFTGPTSRLLMTATLKQLRGLSLADQLKSVSATTSTSTTQPAVTTALTSNVVSPAVQASTSSASSTQSQPAAAAQPAPQPAAAPAAPAPPRTRTVYVCPDGFTDVSGTCTTTLPYTYSTLAYTFHQEPYTVTVQDPPTVYAADRAQSTGTLCPWGGSPNAGGDLCSIAGGTHQETRYNTVKDATPAGYTDTGTEWKKKNAAPTGYSDDGTQWVKTTARIATEVPA
jgi:hypothetical protein